MMLKVQKKMLELLRKPGRKPEVRGLAPTQIVTGKVESPGDEEQNIAGFVGTVKQRRLDRWLDHVVKFSGSQFAFFSILAALLTWALLGIKFGRKENWQVIISDAQALLCYVYDSLLTRQQLNSYTDDIAVAIQMQSRSESNLRMLSKLKDRCLPERQAKGLEGLDQSFCIQEDIAVKLPPESRFGRFATTFALVLGHVVTLSLFWVGVFIWLGIGHMFDFSDRWQLYMNSATSALMVFTFALLANIHERHSEHTKKSLDLLFTADSSLELRLRCLTHDVQVNEEVVVQPPNVGKIQRAIFYYADFVGTLVGIAILITVIAVWIAIGPALQYSSNWWLLIGTYAGLIGMFDGFVLRNMQSCLRSYTDRELQTVHEMDRLLFNITNLPFPVATSGEKVSTTTRISQTLDRITSHEFAVVAAFLTMIGLLAGSSAMKWSLTGQLLSNVPPSIIESFLMMVLVTGHNLIENKKRAELQILYKRRLSLLSYVEGIQIMEEGTEGVKAIESP